MSLQLTLEWPHIRRFPDCDWQCIPQSRGHLSKGSWSISFCTSPWHGQEPMVCRTQLPTWNICSRGGANRHQVDYGHPQTRWPRRQILVTLSIVYAPDIKFWYPRGIIGYFKILDVLPYNRRPCGTSINKLLQKMCICQLKLAFISGSIAI